MATKPTTFADITPERIAEHNQMVASINGLVAGLEKAAAEFSKPVDPESVDDEHQRRQGSARAIEAVVKFLDVLGVDARLRQPLMRLVEALGDAEDGITSPATAPRKHTGGPRTPFSDDQLRIRAAVTVTLLIWAQESLPDALRKACRAAGNNLTVDDLKDYRKRLGSGKKVSALAKEQYHQHLSDARHVIKNGGTARKLANAALTLLRQTKVD